ncbi:hypothetical protein BDZ91DRAFT_801744 [Kalaharituber pfeilii]|nr:hypothetical protein BDZ91DRAFT_801744 [Kalaharituber pfeilii]
MVILTNRDVTASFPADSSRRSGFSSKIALMFASLLLLWAPTLVSGDIEMLPFSLTRMNPSSSVGDYAMHMQLGPPENYQNLYLLPVLFTSEVDDNGGKQDLKPLCVPSSQICLDQKKQADEWNPFISPGDQDTVNKSDGTYIVEWDPSPQTEKVNLSLRKGITGAQGRNVTVIEMGITNNGRFEWNVAQTAEDHDLMDQSDLSLMLWTDSPQRRSYSPNFSIVEIDDDSLRKKPRMRNFSIVRRDTPQGSEAFDACMDYFAAHGGLYNYTLDESFTSDGATGTIKDPVSGWKADIVGSGETQVKYLRMVVKMGVNIINSTTQGLGTIALADLQQLRTKNAGLEGNSAENVVGLYLGSGDSAGHVTLGGHNRAIIDDTQGSAVFSKRKNTRGQFEVQLVGIKYIPHDPEKQAWVGQEAADGEIIPMDKTQLRLSYNSPTILLPESILSNLLPYLGAPKYNKELNGHVYDASPKTDYSLKFTFVNSTAGNSLNITVPASSLLTEEPSTDNPLTKSQFEAGRKYLLLAPLREEGGIGYLGRAFLKHTYLVDDAHLGKFYLSAVNTTAVAEEASKLITRSDGLMDDGPLIEPPIPTANTPAEENSDNGSHSKTSLVGPILGGIIGGIAVLWLIFLLFYLRTKRARSRTSSEEKDELNLANNGIEKKIIEATAAAREGASPPTEFATFKGVDIPPMAQLHTPITVHQASSLVEGDKITTIVTISDTSSLDNGNFSTGKPPTPPVKDQEYRRQAVKRYSHPIPRHYESSYDPHTVKRQSVPLMALDALGSGPYASFHYNRDDASRNQNPSPRFPTYDQLLAHHQARRQRASYVNSASSHDNDNDDDNDGTASATTSTETATVGKVIAKGQVAKIRQISSTPPHVAQANLLERRASVGRVVTPSDIVVVVPSSRRTSRSSKELLQSPRKSPSPGGSSNHSGSGSSRDRAQGHRRGKSAPVDLGMLLLANTLDPRAQDDGPTSEIRTVSVGYASSTPATPTIRRVPVRAGQLVTESPPSTFLADPLSDGVSSSSSTALPRNSRLVRRTDSESTAGSGIGVCPVSPLSGVADGQYIHQSGGGRGDQTPLSPVTPPLLDQRYP